jgi:hypothetical protein
MRFKFGLALGLAAGYVLGTRAGRQRYEQIRRWWGQVSNSPTVHRATERAQAVAGQRARRALYAVQSGVERAGGAVKDRLSHTEDPTAEMKARLASPESSGADAGTSPPDASEAWAP